MSKRSFGSVAREGGAVQQGGREWPPNGEYTATAVAANTGKTQNGAKPKIGVRVIVDTGEHKGKAGWVNQTLSVESDAAVDIFVRTLGAFGFSPEFFDQYDIEDGEALVTALAEQVVGKRARIKVADGKSPQGTPRPEVKFVNPIRATDPEPEVELNLSTNSAPRPNVAVHQPGKFPPGLRPGAGAGPAKPSF